MKLLRTAMTTISEINDLAKVSKETEAMLLVSKTNPTIKRSKAKATGSKAAIAFRDGLTLANPFIVAFKAITTANKPTNPLMRSAEFMVFMEKLNATNPAISKSKASATGSRPTIALQEGLSFSIAFSAIPRDTTIAPNPITAFAMSLTDNAFIAKAIAINPAETKAMEIANGKSESTALVEGLILFIAFINKAITPKIAINPRKPLMRSFGLASFSKNVIPANTAAIKATDTAIANNPATDAPLIDKPFIDFINKAITVSKAVIPIKP